MCFPGASIAIPAAISGAEALRQRSIARDQNRYQRRLAKINRELVDAGAQRQLTALRFRQLEQRQAAAQQIQEIVSRARSFQGQALASAAESGTAGSSLADITAQFERDQLRSQAVLDRQVLRQGIQADRQGEAIRDAQRRGQVASLPQPFVEPNVGLAIGIGALSGLGNELARPNTRIPDLSQVTRSSANPLGGANFNTQILSNLFQNLGLNIPPPSGGVT